MPWLSRPGSRVNSAEHSASTGSPPPSPNMPLDSQSKPATMVMQTPVVFVPAQIDGLCGTSAPSGSMSPMMQMRRSMGTMMEFMSGAPKMMGSLMSMSLLRGYATNGVACRDLVLQSVLGLMQMAMLVVGVPAMMVLPGVGGMVMLALCWALMSIMMYPLNAGKRVVRVSCDGAMEDDRTDECWMFVNSMMTSHDSMMQQCQRLSMTFRRTIVGVHNRTNGPMLDMAHMSMSDLLPSTTKPVLATQIRNALLNPSIRKVVLMAHGTGTIPLTQALDSLHANLPMATMSKIEVYTFGAAASHLHNPLLQLDEMSRPDFAVPMNGDHGSSVRRERSPNPVFTRMDGSIASPVKATLASLGHRVEDLEAVMLHVEHYAMANDALARTGVIRAMHEGTARFAGRLFMLGGERKADRMEELSRKNLQRMEQMRAMGLMGRMNRRVSDTMVDMKGMVMMGQMKRSIVMGCTFDAYMDALFPMTSQTACVLDSTVSVDVQIAERREFTAQSLATPMKPVRRLSGVMSNGTPNSGYMSPRMNGNGMLSPPCEDAPRSRKEKRNSWGTTTTLGIDGVGKARQGARECEGCTVRQLSRLWRYMDGKRPVGEGVPHPAPGLNGLGISGMGVTINGKMEMGVSSMEASMGNGASHQHQSPTQGQSQPQSPSTQQLKAMAAAKQLEMQKHHGRGGMMNTNGTMNMSQSAGVMPNGHSPLMHSQTA